MKHWHKAQTTTSSHHHYWSPPHKQSNPIDIEMSSYALLVYAHNKAFADGLSVMKWLTTQRNSNGGFASTQVTSHNHSYRKSSLVLIYKYLIVEVMYVI